VSSTKSTACCVPFFGAGTVGLVSRRIGRGFLGIEIKQEYALMAAERLGWDLSRIEVIDD